ncbi:unnamed protein product [Adineta steineri]|uniref:DYW domain-containing protein n=1 Tax=Adineta steineri TaxID=433720 RepID=A0A813YU89_9BILA|nr:unnamed protein product [Adineta steineri]
MKFLNDNKQFNKTLELFDKHRKSKIQTFSSFTITQALKACTHLGDLQRGKNIHHLISTHIKEDVYISTSLIHLYMQCGDVQHAELLFDKSTDRVLPMYGAMMKGYLRNNMTDKAIDFFNKIENPHEILVNLLFNTCAQIKTTDALSLVKKVSKEMPKSFHSNPYILSSLLDAFMKCKDVKHAELLFDQCTSKVLPMYGAIMKGYIENNQANNAIDLFNKIETPNKILINLLFNACAQLGTNEALGLVKKVSQEMPKSFYSDLYILSSLLDAFMKCKDVKHAELLFNKCTNKDLPMYGAMMKGYIENNQANKAIDLFNKIEKPDEFILSILFNICAQLGTNEALSLVKKVSQEMPKSFHSNPYILSSLLDALIKCEDVKHAELLFNKSTNKDLPMYGAIMNAYNKEDKSLKALNLFNQMKIDGDYSICESIVKDIPDVLLNNEIENALIDMWGKCGCTDKAKEVFEKNPKPDQVAYTTMINSYGLNGMGVQALELNRKMPEEFINEVTYICVLNACSHSGLIEEARSIFKNIPTKTERINGTMIDCLSRGSYFEEAEELIDEYERFDLPVLTMYMALLSGARNANNSELSQNIYDRMRKSFPDIKNSLTPAAVLLANAYTSSGDIDTASNIRNELNRSGAKKKIGLSWTVINGHAFEFRAHDQSHPRSTEIYAEIKKISKQLIQHGHQYDSSWITRPLNDDETVESVLCGHSERLAIAWNFVQNPNATQIQVTNNLRVCGDCHRAIKLIAAIRQCEIIVRDANRIHHFSTNGQCSCNDYF